MSEHPGGGEPARDLRDSDQREPVPGRLSDTCTPGDPCVTRMHREKRDRQAPYLGDDDPHLFDADETDERRRIVFDRSWRVAHAPPPRERAWKTASPRLCTPTTWSIARTCVLTVVSDTPSSRAICLSDRPRIIARKTST